MQTGSRPGPKRNPEQFRGHVYFDTLSDKIYPAHVRFKGVRHSEDSNKISPLELEYKVNKCEVCSQHFSCVFYSHS